jgi:spore coat protein U-like protein
MNRFFILLGALSISLPAFAGTDSSNMAVSATVTDTCTISAGALAFGSYDPVAGTAVDGTATLSVACTEGSTSLIALDQGVNPDGTSTDAAPVRQMASGTDLLGYSLWQDAGHTTAWGNTAGTSSTYEAPDSSTSSITVYGQITGGQSVPAGSYTDTVVAEITF